MTIPELKTQLMLLGFIEHVSDPISDYLLDWVMCNAEWAVEYKGGEDTCFVFQPEIGTIGASIELDAIIPYLLSGWKEELQKAKQDSHDNS